MKHAVQRHGGEVELWSRPGRGSTFTVRLSVVEPPENTLVKGSRRTKPKKQKNKSKPKAARDVAPTKGDPS